MRCYAMRRGGFNNPSGWYEPGAASPGSSDRTAAPVEQPAAQDEWHDAADSLPSGRFSAADTAAGNDTAAGSAEAARAAAGSDNTSTDGSSAVRFLDEELDGALFMNQDSTWTGAADAAPLASSLQAQLPDWATGIGGKGSGDGSTGGFGASDSTASGSGALAAAGSGSQDGGGRFGAKEPADAPLQQPVGAAAEDLAARLQLAAEADYDFSDPMALLTADLEEADLQARCFTTNLSVLGCTA